MYFKYIEAFYIFTRRQKPKYVFPCDKWSTHMICCALRTFGKRISHHAPFKHNPIMSQTRVCMCVNLCLRMMQACWAAALRPMALDTQHFVLSCVTLKDHNRRAAFSFHLTLLIGYLTKRANVWHHHKVSDYSLSKNHETRQQNFFFRSLFKCAKVRGAIACHLISILKRKSVYLKLTTLCRFLSNSVALF